MKQNTTMLVLILLLACTTRLVAGPVGGARIAKDQPISPNKPAEVKLKFKGGERAGVLVKGELKKPGDIHVEIRDNNGKLVTKDDFGGPFVAVIWYPPQDAFYTIKITVKGDQAQNCYIVIR